MKISFDLTDPQWRQLIDALMMARPGKPDDRPELRELIDKVVFEVLGVLTNDKNS